jgi:hypothetical protein
MPDSYKSLRPEAGPVPFENLQRRAKEAISRIIPALCETAANAKIASTESAGTGQTRSEIDTNRASRLFFVSGEPGSGKSTVYLTLKTMTSAGEKFEEYGKSFSNPHQLSYLKKVVQWLEPLDLEVAGDERDNLLAAVLVRLFDALQRSDSSLSEPCGAAIKELEELATDIGIAWEGNLQARAGALDPATYSEEVMLAQRARLGVNTRLKQALDRLAKNRCCGCDESTLFVLPVEDLYLKPDASLQLLRLLRMISVPRLFFLLLGDIKTVEALFTEKALADWTAVAGARTFTPMRARLNQALARARELRARYLRKLLPPGQRAEIEAMDWDEALQFKPYQFPEAKPLKSLLRETPLDRASGSLPSDDLLTFLVSPPLEESEPETANDGPGTPPPESSEENREARKRQDEQRKGAQAAYTALQILDATPREIMDLWFALNIPRNQDDQAPVLRLVEEFARYVVDEQSFLDDQEQTALLNIFPTRHYFDRELDLKNLQLDPETGQWTPTVKSKTRRRLWFRKQRSWTVKVGVNVQLKDPSDTTNKLPPRPAAWIALWHDLSFSWNGNVNGSPVEKLCDLLNEQHQERKEESELGPPTDLGWFVFDDRSGYTHFPMPHLRSYKQLDRFFYVWNSGVDWHNNRPVAEEEKQVERLISLWLLAGRTMDDRSYAEFAARDEDWFEKHLAKSNKASPQDVEHREWVTNVRKFKTKAPASHRSRRRKP